MTSIMVVDDHEVVQEGLAVALNAMPGITVVGSASTGADALTLLKRTLPELALVDFRLPDMPGDDLCRRLLQILPSLRPIMLTTYLNEEIVGRAAAAGAYGFVTKSAGLSLLRSTLDEVRGGQSQPMVGTLSIVVKQCHAAAATHHADFLLTPQQERILELTTEGLTYRAIADRLFISESTVRFHVQNLKTKLNARTKADLVATAIRSALIHPAES